MERIPQGKKALPQLLKTPEISEIPELLDNCEEIKQVETEKMKEVLENNRTSFPKAVQYADEILEGKYTFDSLKGQVPDSWVDAVGTELESRGFLILSDNNKNIEHVLNTPEQFVENKENEIINTNLKDLNQYFIENTNPTPEWRYKPDLDGDGEYALREQEETLLQLGADQIQAHGIAKGSVGEQFNSLLNILTKGVDSRGGGMLYTAPLVIDSEFAAGVGAALGTGGGTAYVHGGFIVLAKKGIYTIQHTDDIGGVLVNQAVADSLPELVQKLKISFPNLSIESYENSPKAIQEIKSK